jgi:hypothetical protein
VGQFQEHVAAAYERETGVLPAIIAGGIPGGVTVTST